MHVSQSVCKEILIRQKRGGTVNPTSEQAHLWDPRVPCYDWQASFHRRCRTRDGLGPSRPKGPLWLHVSQLLHCSPHSMTEEGLLQVCVLGWDGSHGIGLPDLLLQFSELLETHDMENYSKVLLPLELSHFLLLYNLQLQSILLWVWMLNRHKVHHNCEKEQKWSKPSHNCYSHGVWFSNCPAWQKLCLGLRVFAALNCFLRAVFAALKNLLLSIGFFGNIFLYKVQAISPKHWPVSLTLLKRVFLQHHGVSIWCAVLAFFHKIFFVYIW